MYLIEEDPSLVIIYAIKPLFSIFSRPKNQLEQACKKRGFLVPPPSLSSQTPREMRLETRKASEYDANDLPPHIENHCTGVWSEFPEVRTLHATHETGIW